MLNPKLNLTQTVIWLAAAATLAVSATVLGQAAAQAPATQRQPLLEAARVQRLLLGGSLLGLLLSVLIMGR